MPRFTEDNTEGYTPEQIDELNRRFEAALEAEQGELGRALDIYTTADKSLMDRIAEKILTDFDTSLTRT